MIFVMAQEANDEISGSNNSAVTRVHIDLSLVVIELY